MFTRMFVSVFACIVGFTHICIFTVVLMIVFVVKLMFMF